MSRLFTLPTILVAAAALFLLWASTYKLSEAPGIWYDEGFYTQIAMNVASFGRQYLQTAPQHYAATTYISVGYPLIFPVALSYKLFGAGVLQGRAVMVLFICVLAVASYFLTASLFGKKDAAWSLAILATFAMLYGDGKSVLGEVPGLFFCIAALWVLRRLEKRMYADWQLYAWLGLAAGLCAATKPSFILLLAALFITLLVCWKRITISWWGAAAGTAALFAPLGLWALLQLGPDASWSSLLADYANPYAVGNLPAHILANAAGLFTDATPLYALALFAVWSTALVVRCFKKEKVPPAEIAAYAFCVLTILSYLRLQGFYRYLFPEIAISLLFFAPSLRYLANLLGARQKYAPYAASIVLALLALGQAYQTVHASYVAQYYGGTRTRDMSAYLSSLSGKSIFLYNTPELAILLHSNSYYQYLSPLPNVTIGTEELPALENRMPDYVIIGAGAPEINSPALSGYTLERTIDRYAVLARKNI